MTKFTSLEKRVERLENILIELALYPKRCKYIYSSELKNLLINKRLVKEKKTWTKVEPKPTRRVQSLVKLSKIKQSVTKKRMKAKKRACK